MSLTQFMRARTMMSPSDMSSKQPRRQTTTLKTKPLGSKLLMMKNKSTKVQIAPEKEDDRVTRQVELNQDKKDRVDQWDHFVQSHFVNLLSKVKQANRHATHREPDPAIVSEAVTEELLSKRADKVLFKPPRFTSKDCKWPAHTLRE